MTTHRGFHIAIALLVAILAILAVPTMAGTPVGTAFAYQGKLTDSSGTPVSGNRDMTFKLFDALTAGNQVGATVAKTGVNVSGGLFAVPLDFSIGVFLGEKRWLETAVAGETISPRVELTPTPNAIVAANALVTRSHCSGLVGVADTLECTEGVGLGGCVAKQTITLALAYGQTITLDLLDFTKVPLPGDPYPYAEVVRLEITKTKRTLKLPGQSGSPDTQVDLADSPVVTIKLTKGDSVKIITISPEDPLYNTKEDPICIADPSKCPLSLQANLLSDSQLRFVVDKQQIRVVTVNSVGAIASAAVAPYKPGAREVELSVTVWNGGDSNGDFIVTVTGLGPYAEPVAARSVTLYALESSTQKFTLRSTKPFTSADTYTVNLKSPSGWLKDSITSHFPAPTAP